MPGMPPEFETHPLSNLKDRLQIKALQFPQIADIINNWEIKIKMYVWRHSNLVSIIESKFIYRHLVS